MNKSVLATASAITLVIAFLGYINNEGFSPVRMVILLITIIVCSAIADRISDDFDKKNKK